MGLRRCPLRPTQGISRRWHGDFPSIQARASGQYWLVSGGGRIIAPITMIMRNPMAWCRAWCTKGKKILKGLECPQWYVEPSRSLCPHHLHGARLPMRKPDTFQGPNYACKGRVLLASDGDSVTRNAERSGLRKRLKRRVARELRPLNNAGRLIMSMQLMSAILGSAKARCSFRSSPYCWVDQRTRGRFSPVEHDKKEHVNWAWNSREGPSPDQRMTDVIVVKAERKEADPTNTKLSSTHTSSVTHRSRSPVMLGNIHPLIG